MITKQDWNAVQRQGYSAEEQQGVDDFIAENGESYDSVQDALADARALGVLS